MKKLLLLIGVVAVALVGAGLVLGAKPPPAPPAPPPPPYALRMLTNEFGRDSSTVAQLNDLGDAIGYAESAEGRTVSFVTVPESRAAGVDMVDIQQLLIDGGFCDPTPGERSGWFLNDIAGMTNSRQIAVSLHLAQDDQSTGMKPAYLQLAVSPAGAVSISSVTDISSPLTDAYDFRVSAVNHDGDIVGDSANHTSRCAKQC